MTGFIALEMRRSLRDIRYLVIAVAMPIGLYLLFTGLFGAHGQRAQGLPQPAELMIAMIAYGAMWAVFSATGPRIAHERAIGWTRQLRVTPLSAASALSGKLVTALAAALPAMMLVAVTAVLSHHVQLSAAQWLAMQDIGQALPSNGVAELGWRIAGGQAPVPKAVLVLTAWLLGSATAALLAYRRRNTQSAH